MGEVIMPKALDTVGLQLNERRLQARLSMDELAQRMGFSGQSSVQRYLAPDYDLELRPDIERKFALAFGDALSPAAIGVTPIMVLRTILCANPTAEQVETALATNGFKIVAAPTDDAVPIKGKVGKREYSTKGIGKRIRTLREGRGWNQADLAEKLDVSVQAISQWETGKHSPDIENVVAAAGLFDVPPHAILWDEGA